MTRPLSMDATGKYSGIRSSWLIPLRLVAFSLICGVSIVWLGYPSFIQKLFLIYSITTLVSFCWLLLAKSSKAHTIFGVLIALHFLSEIICEAGITYSTGVYNSPFTVLFLLTIVSAALVYRLAGTLITASVVSAVYSGVVWANASGVIKDGPLAFSRVGGTLPVDTFLFYATFLYVLIFFLVAFIAGYLAEKLQSKDQELHSASVELKKMKLETGDILRHLNSGLLTMTGNGEVVFFNRAAEMILEVREEEVSGHNCREVFVGRLSVLADHLMSVLESQEWISRSELEVANSEGKIIPVGISTSVLFDENREARGVIAIFQDITESKLVEERIRYADRMAAIGELSASIAHEIRNPLASISGSVEVLKNDLTLEGDNEKLMSLIIKESLRLNKILSDFLVYARVGRTQLKKVELNRVVSDAIDVARRHPAFKSGTKIELHSENNVVYVSGDEDQLKQLILNLIVNACESMTKESGLIRFEVTTVRDIRLEDRVCLTIRDNGHGIPPEKLSKIFIPFYSTKKEGTGLGLAIVSRLMEAHNGRVEVSSKVGVGSEFRLYFNGIAQELISAKIAPPRPVSF